MKGKKIGGFLSALLAAILLMGTDLPAMAEAPAPDGSTSDKPSKEITLKVDPEGAGTITANGEAVTGDTYTVGEEKVSFGFKTNPDCGLSYWSDGDHYLGTNNFDCTYAVAPDTLIARCSIRLQIFSKGEGHAGVIIENAWGVVPDVMCPPGDEVYITSQYGDGYILKTLQNKKTGEFIPVVAGVACFLVNEPTELIATFKEAQFVTLSPALTTIQAGKQARLEADFTEDNYGADCGLQSSDRTVADVSWDYGSRDVIVTGVNPGQATISMWTDTPYGEQRSEVTVVVSKGSAGTIHPVEQAEGLPENERIQEAAVGNLSADVIPGVKSDAVITMETRQLNHEEPDVIEQLAERLDKAHDRYPYLRNIRPELLKPALIFDMNLKVDGKTYEDRLKRPTHIALFVPADFKIPHFLYIFHSDGTVELRGKSNGFQVIPQEDGRQKILVDVNKFSTFVFSDLAPSSTSTSSRSSGGSSMVGFTSYVITAKAGPGGSISSPGETRYDAGTSVTYTITPNAGYAVDKVIVDGKNEVALTNGTYTFRLLNQPYTIEATFKPVSGGAAQPSAPAAAAPNPATGDSWFTHLFF